MGFVTVVAEDEKCIHLGRREDTKATQTEKTENQSSEQKENKHDAEHQGQQEIQRQR